MASVSFEGDSRSRGRMPLSFYEPFVYSGDRPLVKVLPTRTVPKGKGSAKQQIGYWNEQPRWRMVKGVRKDLPSKWHFYYYGTGPHADAKFRTRIDGVCWVSLGGSSIEPTGLGTRKRNEQLLNLDLPVKLPEGAEIVEVQQNVSRTPSTSRDRSQSGRRNGNDEARSNNNNNKNQKSRSNSQTRGGNKQEPVDIAAAVKKALQELGLTANNGNNKKKNSSGASTPKEQRAKSPARTSPSVQRKQMDRPLWKRVPTEDEDVTMCFGQRDAKHNFGSTELVTEGIRFKHYPQIAELIPTPAALLFGSDVKVHEVGDDVEITYVFKMKVKKDDKNLSYFLQQVNQGNAPRIQASVQLNPAADSFVPDVAVEDEQVEIIDQVLYSPDDDNN